MHYKVGVAMHNMARWMQYTLKWRDYYKQQKKKMCHQESKGIVQQVFRKWYRQGQFSNVLSNLVIYPTVSAFQYLFCPWAVRPAVCCPAVGEGPRGRQRRSAH